MIFLLCNRQIQTTQFAFNFSYFVSFNYYNPWRRKFCIPKTVFRKLGRQCQASMWHLQPSECNVLSLFLEMFRTNCDMEVKLHCCNKFPKECVVSFSWNNLHFSQKKDFCFFSFLILAAHNAQHQFLISASFCITAERANICKYFAHRFCMPLDWIGQNLICFRKFCN